MAQARAIPAVVANEVSVVAARRRRKTAPIAAALATTEVVTRSVRSHGARKRMCHGTTFRARRASRGSPHARARPGSDRLRRLRYGRVAVVAVVLRLDPVGLRRDDAARLVRAVLPLV